MEYIILLVLLIVYCLSCICLGAIIVALLRPNSTQDLGLTALASHFLLGQGILAIIWLIAALFALFSPPFIVATLLLCIVAGIRHAQATVRHALHDLRTIASRVNREPFIWKLIITFVIILVILTAFKAFALPSWDGMSFYLAFPKVVAATQRLTVLPGFESFVAMFGLQGEMNFAALMALGNEAAARLFVWPTSLATALMVLSIGKRVGLGRRGQWITLASLYTTTTFTNLTGDGKTDIFPAAMGVAAFYWVLVSQGGNDTGALRLTGLFAGLSIMAKITYIGTLLPCIGVLFIWQYLAVNVKAVPPAQLLSSLIKRLFQLGLWFALPLLPIVLKNALVFGQIVPAALFRYLGAQDQKWISDEATQKAILTYPFALTFGLPNPNLYGNLSPLPLIFAPLICLLERPRNLLKSPLFQLSVSALLGVVLWVIFGSSVLVIRYMFAALFMLFLLSMRGAETASYLKIRPIPINAIINLCIIVPLVLSVQYFAPDILAVSRRLSGHTLNCDDDQDGRSCVLLAVNQDASPGSRIFMHANPRFWLRADLLQCLSTWEEGHLVRAFATPEERWNYVYAHGFRYLIIDHQHFNLDVPAESSNPLDLNKLPQGLKLIPLYDKPDIVSAYRLDWGNKEPSASLACQETRPQVWEVKGRE